jgi:hypothetical protein
MNLPHAYVDSNYDRCDICGMAESHLNHAQPRESITLDEIKRAREHMRQSEERDRVNNVDRYVIRTDPWKHRLKAMTCSTCMWYVIKARVADGSNNIGRCRRHAPTIQGYPVVFEHDWCGDHKLDENKS